MREIEFWYDFASTYSYLTAARIEPLAEAAGVAVVWRPFLLGPIFAAQGWTTSVFNIYPAKGAHMWRDMERMARRYGLPYRRPTAMPRNSLLPARVATLAEPEGWCPAFSRAVFRANFEEDRDIGAASVVGEILAGVGQDPDAVLARAGAPDNKDRLRARVEEAQTCGVFGAPTFFVGGELFWGNDRLEQALEWAASPPAEHAAA